MQGRQNLKRHLINGIKLNRRRLLIGSAAGLGTSFAAVEYGTAIAGKDGYRSPPHYNREPKTQDYDDQHPQEVGHHAERYAAHPTPIRRRDYDCIAFWADSASQLVALDHSIDAKDARAYGPCAAARAMALAHVVMADAVAAVYPVDYEGLYVRQHLHVEFPDTFVGGAVAWILEYIFNTPVHSQYIGGRRIQFLEGREPAALRAWEAGLTFARNEAFTSHWDGKAISEAIQTTPTVYVAPPRGHTVDPFNPDQGFYGQGWGRIPPLTPNFGDIAAYGPGDPPTENNEEYRHDFEDVLNVGAYRPDEPTPEQVRSALFWAYCGPRLIGAPTRLYNLIIRKIAEDDGVPPPEMARLLALCNLALADAGTVCWAAKYYYKTWRPVVAIRQQTVDWRPFGGPRTNPSQFALGIDTRFRVTAQNYIGASPGSAILPQATSHRLPYKLACFTPNFPSYPSGHASFGAGCFGILRKIRAEYRRDDPDRINPNLHFVSDELNGLSIDNFVNRPRPYVPRTFTSLSQMIEDLNRSRIHLGVHFNFDCKYGAQSGLRVAKAVYDNAYRRAQGHPEVSEYEQEDNAYRRGRHREVSEYHLDKFPSIARR